MWINFERFQLPRRMFVSLQAWTPSAHVCSASGSSLLPHLRNHVPPIAQQLRMPMSLNVPHAGHAGSVAVEMCGSIVVHAISKMYDQLCMTRTETQQKLQQQQQEHARHFCFVFVPRVKYLNRSNSLEHEIVLVYWTSGLHWRRRQQQAKQNVRVSDIWLGLSESRSRNLIGREILDTQSSTLRYLNLAHLHQLTMRR